MNALNPKVSRLNLRSDVFIRSTRGGGSDSLCRAGNGRASVPAADVNAMRASCRATAIVPGLAELRQTGNYRVLTPNDLASIFALLRPIPGFATLLLGDRLTRAFQGARRPAV